MTSGMELQERIAELEQELAKASEIDKISRALNAARSEDELLHALAQTAIASGAFSVSLAYADLGETGDLEWLEIVANWQREGVTLSPVGTRFYVPEFPFSNLWLSDPEKAQLIEEVATDERLDVNTRNLLLRVGTQASAIVPLSQAGRWVGLVVIVWNTPHQFTAVEEAVYHTLPALAAAAVENLRLIVEKQKAIVDKLYGISRKLNTAHDLDELFEILLQPGKDAGAMVSILFYIDLDQTGEPEWIEAVASWHRDGLPVIPPGTRMLLRDFPLCQLFLDNPDSAILVPDGTIDERVDPNSRDAVENIGAKGLVIVPLTQAGRWVGALDFFWDDVHEFSEQEREIYDALVGLVAAAVDSRRLVDQLEEMVNTRTAELRQSEERLRAVVSTVPLVIFSTDKDGTLTLAEGKGLESIGVTPGDLVGQSIFDLYQDNPTAVETLHRTLAGESTSFVSEVLETFYDNWVNPVCDANGEVIGMLGVSFDITERRQTEEERARLQQQVIDAQQAALRELSSPIIPVMEGIIVLPLVGNIDTSRAREITRVLLAGITQYRAKVVILDITGVPMVDSGVADHLNKTIQAARLKGARPVITGVSDAVAETVVDLGINWNAVETLRDLQTGLVTAIRDLGIQLDKIR
ncbi:MAG: PAS domain-containing protein [Anaerolineae bacterium]|nr:PAS domain-containing protein [Anaerolineae bacterium]